MSFLQRNGLWSALLSLCDSGHETKAMMNNSGPRYKRSQLEKRLNTDILWCVLLLIIMCLTASIGVRRHWLTPHSSRLTTQQQFIYKNDIFTAACPVNKWTLTHSWWMLQRLRDSTNQCWVIQIVELLWCLGVFQVTASGWKTSKTLFLRLMGTRLLPWLASMSSGLWSLFCR